MVVRQAGQSRWAADSALAAGVKLRCEAIERDRHGRLVAKVFSPNRVDIGRRLVSAGWALACRRYSMDYVAAEDEARWAKRGTWRDTFVKPWEWRALAPPRGKQAASASAARRDAWGMVKGQSSELQRTCHMKP
jgi:endonuclease YncB( thermonuclease family)